MRNVSPNEFSPSFLFSNCALFIFWTDQAKELPEQVGRRTTKNHKKRQNHLIYLRYLVCWHSAFYSLWTYQAKHFLLEIHILPCEISLNPISEEISSSAAEWLSKWGDQGSVPNGIGYAPLGQRLSSISFICTFFYFLQILLCQKPAKPCHN